MSVVWQLVLAAALVVGATPNDAAAFCRATTNKNAVCGEIGEPLWWGTPCLSYAIDGDGSLQLDPAELRATVDAAFIAWSSVICDAGPTDIQFQRLADSTCMIPEYNNGGGNVNTVAFLDPWVPPTEDIELEPLALGLTVIWNDTETGEIFDADMLINDERPLALCAIDEPCTGFDLESIVTHEAGHFVGIGHSPIESSTMFEIAGSPGEIGMRTLDPDDVDAICTVYPPGSLQPQCDDSDFTPRGGLDLNCEDNIGNGGGGCSAAIGDHPRQTWSWTLVGLGLLLWSRRRRFA